jgi:hypothetical protein
LKALAKFGNLHGLPAAEPSMPDIAPDDDCHSTHATRDLVLRHHLAGVIATLRA